MEELSKFVNKSFEQSIKGNRVQDLFNAMTQSELSNKLITDRNSITGSFDNSDKDNDSDSVDIDITNVSSIDDSKPSVGDGAELIVNELKPLSLVKHNLIRGDSVILSDNIETTKSLQSCQTSYDVRLKLKRITKRNLSMGIPTIGKKPDLEESDLKILQGKKTILQF
uniref:Uncharacterized protein n=1 Tax=Glossina palpalis gambiensis TaxID=67801 RepID=A0A1B0BD26_9MUSC